MAAPTNGASGRLTVILIEISPFPGKAKGSYSAFPMGASREKSDPRTSIGAHSSPRRVFQGTSRFKIIQKLGEGGMGAVYECRDLEKGSIVALKTLLFADPATLLYFKDEFRQFQDIHHENLISLGELFEEDGLWFFTMELVHGDDFLTHARRGILQPGSDTENTLPADQITQAKGMVKGVGGYSVNVDHLRDTLPQLARGLMALHEHGKIHCDVKPSNAMVTRDGRVVLLDFGVARDISRGDQLKQPGLGGTPAYMAPEQIAAMPISPASDWYAVGAMLFEVLTGRLPFEGNIMVLVENKLKNAPPDPRTFAPDVPTDLAELAMALLATVPEDRPTGDIVLRRLLGQDLPSPSIGAEQQPKASGVNTIRVDTQSTPFVGRATEIALLDSCFARSQNEREAIAVYVQGESGVGKSAVVRRFTDRVRLEDAAAIVLTGACYEHETVPYKAVDGLVDSLSRYLERLPNEEIATLLPLHVATLAQAFPVLGRVEAIAESPRARTDVDPLERRSRVFAALRELLANMGKRAPLVLYIDDLQWADSDSLALLGDILRGPDSPRLLLLATVRVEAGQLDLQLPVGPIALPPGGTLINVPRLLPSEAQELVEALAFQVGTEGALIDAASVAGEAQGYPLFLHELVRYHAVHQDKGQRPIALEDALWARIQVLDEPSRKLLQVISLAPAAMMQATATRAAGIEGSDATKHIKRLKAAHFVRTTGGTRGTDLIEPYHGRTREAVRAKIPSDQKRLLHRRIAVVMETSNLHEPEDLAVHWREAGEAARAVEYAEKAAVRAEEALAFDRAAGHYRMVEELGVLEGSQRRDLLKRLGTALANAGRSQEAAGAFRTAIVGATPNEARELARLAAEHLLRSGHLDEGLLELRRVLETVGVSYPDTTGAAVGSLVLSRARLALRGLDFKPVETSSIKPETIARMDAIWAATTGLLVADQLRGVTFAYRHLLLALSSGDRFRIVRGLAIHAIATVVEGAKKRDAASKIVALARRYAERETNPYANAVLDSTESGVAFLSGDFEQAIERGKVAVENFRSNCIGVAWELASARQNIFWSLAYTGRLQELSRVASSGLREALESGDQYAAFGIRSGLPNIAWLAQGDAVEARSQADQAVSAWSNEKAFLQHLMNLIAQVDVDLYEGKPARAVERISTVRKQVEGAGLSRVELNRIQLLDVAARADIALAATLSGSERERRLELARKDTALLEKERVPWGRALAAPKRAAIAKLTGSSDSEQLAKNALRVLEQAKLRLYAASVASLTGLSDDKGIETHFVREQVKDIPRFARVFFPGW